MKNTMEQWKDAKARRHAIAFDQSLTPGCKRRREIERTERTLRRQLQRAGELPSDIDMMQQTCDAIHSQCEIVRLDREIERIMTTTPHSQWTAAGLPVLTKQVRALRAEQRETATA